MTRPRHVTRHRCSGVTWLAGRQCRKASGGAGRRPGVPSERRGVPWVLRVLAGYEPDYQRIHQRRVSRDVLPDRATLSAWHLTLGFLKHGIVACGGRYHCNAVPHRLVPRRHAMVMNDWS